MKDIRRLTAALCAAALLLCTAPSALAVAPATPEAATPEQAADAQEGSRALAGQGVAIDAAHFPDPVFRAAVKGYDANKDGCLSEDEGWFVESLSLSDSGLTSLKGIEYLPGLESLSCSRNPGLTSLDLRKNTWLSEVYCDNCSLATLDVSTLDKLDTLICNDNHITSLDLRAATGLRRLIVARNALTKLDLASNTLVESVQLFDQLAPAKAPMWQEDGHWMFDLGAVVGRGELGRVGTVDNDDGSQVYTLGKDGIVDLGDGAAPKNCWYMYATHASTDHILYDYYERYAEWLPVQVQLTRADGPAASDVPRLTRAENGVQGIQLAWSAVPGAQRYRVLCKAGSGAWQQLTETSARSYTWKAAKAGTSYTFAVRAVSGGKVGAASNEKTLVWLPRPTVAAVNVNSAGTDGVRILATNYADGAEKASGATLVFYVREQGQAQWQKAGSVAASKGYSIIWQKGKSGTAYQVTVQATKGGSESARLEGGKNIRYYRAPDLVSVQKAGGGIQFSWKKQAGVSAYRYQVMIRDNGGAWKPTALAPLSKTSYTWMGAKKGHTYKFSVRFVNSEAAGKPTTNASTAVVSGYNTAGLQIKY